MNTLDGPVLPRFPASEAGSPTDRKLAWTGVLLALPALELFGIAPPVSIVISTTGIQLWFLALGLLLLWRALRRPA